MGMQHVECGRHSSGLQDMRTTSNVVTPNSFLLSYTPAAFRTSAAIGTVELTGLEIMLIMACTTAVKMSSHQAAYVLKELEVAST